MKFYLFKKTITNCRKATLLSLKRDEGKITLTERVKLSYHLMFCIYCRRFIKQSHLMDEQMEQLDQAFFENPPHEMSSESMSILQEQIDKTL
jgi:hypothetical protein